MWITIYAEISNPKIRINYLTQNRDSENKLPLQISNLFFFIKQLTLQDFTLSTSFISINISKLICLIKFNDFHSTLY